ncbi:GYD domain-containing protein [Nocardioides sp. Soil805]|uniref:GYD domain-containing protein n=1 Tax=Nocardioides sp. Soil805 TaxID=1736416 RepID=UPI0007162230|nr:GYD domain-containing protein [Nocardioides sp. Soil805]KRF34430.1 GYD domain protein [Nocardioides sp. Soil805]
MAKYMIKASYSPEGIKGVMAKGGSARAEAIEKLASGVGGSVESVYFSFGSDDLFAIIDAPSHEAMAAIAGTVCQTGALSKYETVILLTPAQIDEAANMTIDYTPPGS